MYGVLGAWAVAEVSVGRQHALYLYAFIQPSALPDYRSGQVQAAHLDTGLTLTHAGRPKVPALPCPKWGMRRSKDRLRSAS
jgi:hypothetical protein